MIHPVCSMITQRVRRANRDYIYYPANETKWYRLRRTAIPRLMYALSIPSDYEKNSNRRDYPFRPSDE